MCLHNGDGPVSLVGAGPVDLVGAGNVQWLGQLWDGVILNKVTLGSGGSGFQGVHPYIHTYQRPLILMLLLVGGTAPTLKDLAQLQPF